MIRNISNVEIKYIYKYKSKNFINYNCKLEKQCKAKIDLEKKKLIFTIIKAFCNNKIPDEELSYEEFVNLYDNKDLRIFILKEKKPKLLCILFY